MNIRKAPIASKKKKYQHGVSLFELIVAMAIGLILLLALATLMFITNRSSINRTTAELMDETARQVFSQLETDLHKAGYIDPFASNETLKEAFDLSEASRLARYIRQKSLLTSPDKTQFTLLGSLSKGKVQPMKGCSGQFAADGSCSGASDSKWHSIQIAYQAVRQDGSDPKLASVSSEKQEEDADSNAAYGCVNVKADKNHPLIINRYYFNPTDSKNVVTAPRDLRCNSYKANFSAVEEKSKTENPMMSGVEEMVLRYLVTPNDNTPASGEVKYSDVVSGRSVEKYLSAEEVEKLDLGWASVVGVEVCLVVAVQPVDGRRELNMANVQPSVPTCLREDGFTANTSFKADIPRPSNWQDLRQYRRYVRTISMPNSLYLSNITL